MDLFVDIGVDENGDRDEVGLEQPPREGSWLDSQCGCVWDERLGKNVLLAANNLFSKVATYQHDASLSGISTVCAEYVAMQRRQDRTEQY